MVFILLRKVNVVGGLEVAIRQHVEVMVIPYIYLVVMGMEKAIQV